MIIHSQIGQKLPLRRYEQMLKRMRRWMDEVVMTEEMHAPGHAKTRGAKLLLVFVAFAAFVHSRLRLGILSSRARRDAKHEIFQRNGPR
jgi:hypothetical protein